MWCSPCSPVGMFVVVSAVSESVDMEWNFKKRREEGKRKWCTMHCWKVLEQELIIVWLTSVFSRFGVAGLEGKCKSWICWRYFKISSLLFYLLKNSADDAKAVDHLEFLKFYSAKWFIILLLLINFKSKHIQYIQHGNHIIMYLLIGYWRDISFLWTKWNMTDWKW